MRRVTVINAGSCLVALVILLFMIGIPRGRFVSKVKTRSHFDDNSVASSLRRDGLLALPSDNDLENMSTAAQFKAYHSYLQNQNHFCNRRLRIGKVKDGGWDVCDDEEYRPVKPCIVYSFGINNDFSFDDGMARFYECDVYSFDPSMKLASHRRSKRVYFFDLGLGGFRKTNPHNWPLKTLGEIMHELNHTQVIIDVLKMDIEGSEHDVIPEMIASGTIRQVRQLSVEWHGKFETLAAKPLKVFAELERLGFKKFHTHSNIHCIFKPKSVNFPLGLSGCYELSYINTLLKQH